MIIFGLKWLFSAIFVIFRYFLTILGLKFKNLATRLSLKMYFRVENMLIKSKKSSFVGKKLITIFWSKFHAVHRTTCDDYLASKKVGYDRRCQSSQTADRLVAPARQTSVALAPLVQELCRQYRYGPFLLSRKTSRVDYLGSGYPVVCTRALQSITLGLFVFGWLVTFNLSSRFTHLLQCSYCIY